MPWYETFPECAEGEYNAPGVGHQGACLPCPPGSFSQEGVLKGLVVNGVLVNHKFRKCNDCPFNTLQWRPNQTSCVACPPEGIDCSSRSEIYMLKGFYRPTDALAVKMGYNQSSLINSVTRCPYYGACDGGNETGFGTCQHADGLWCSKCDVGYHRKAGKCVQCVEHTWGLVLAVLSVINLLVFARLAEGYLRSGVPSLAAGLAAASRASASTHNNKGRRGTRQKGSVAAVAAVAASAGSSKEAMLLQADERRAGGSGVEEDDDDEYDEDEEQVVIALPMGESVQTAREGRLLARTCEGWARRMWRQRPKTFWSDSMAMMKASGGAAHPSYAARVLASMARVHALTSTTFTSTTFTSTAPSSGRHRLHASDACLLAVLSRRMARRLRAFPRAGSNAEAQSLGSRCWLRAPYARCSQRSLLPAVAAPCACCSLRAPCSLCARCSD